MRQLNPAYARRFFAGSMGGYDLGGVRLTPHRFVEPPPDLALRVVVAGASTVQGYPHPARLAAPNFLSTLLADALDRPVQVINLGIRRRADLVGHAPGTDAAFMRKFTDYAGRLQAAPVQFSP